MPDLPEIRFGGDVPLPDWRERPDRDDDADDDAELVETPPDVVGLLGFDPLSVEEG